MRLRCDALSGHHVGMSEPYNRFSGQSVERLTALTDGLFAVAMTLLVLDLRVPASEAWAVLDHGLWDALLKLGPNFGAYLLSFTMLGTFWLAQHTLLTILGRSDRTLTWIHLGFLFVVTLLPFSAALLAEFHNLRLAVGVYWLNILLLGLGLKWSSRYGRQAFLTGEDQALSRLATFRRRILLAQVLYALAALICLASTVASIVALGAVQLYFIVSPRLSRARPSPSAGDDSGRSPDG